MSALRPYFPPDLANYQQRVGRSGKIAQGDEVAGYCGISDAARGLARTLAERAIRLVSERLPHAALSLADWERARDGIEGEARGLLHRLEVEDFGGRAAVREEGGLL